MFSFFGFIFIIILVILLSGISVISAIIRAIFGRGRSNTGNTQSQQRTQTHKQSSANASPDSSIKDRKKVFDKDDGEYVDFEEIKEE